MRITESKFGVLGLLVLSSASICSANKVCENEQFKSTDILFLFDITTDMCNVIGNFKDGLDGMFGEAKTANADVRVAVATFGGVDLPVMKIGFSDDVSQIKSVIESEILSKGCTQAKPAAGLEAIRMAAALGTQANDFTMDCQGKVYSCNHEWRVNTTKNVLLVSDGSSGLPTSSKYLVSNQIGHEGTRNPIFHYYRGLDTDWANEVALAAHETMSKDIIVNLAVNFSRNIKSSARLQYYKPSKSARSPPNICNLMNKNGGKCRGYLLKTLNNKNRISKVYKDLLEGSLNCHDTTTSKSTESNSANYSDSCKPKQNNTTQDGVVNIFSKNGAAETTGTDSNIPECKPLGNDVEDIVIQVNSQNSSVITHIIISEILPNGTKVTVNSTALNPVTEILYVSPNTTTTITQVEQVPDTEDENEFEENEDDFIEDKEDEYEDYENVILSVDPGVINATDLLNETVIITEKPNVTETPINVVNVTGNEVTNITNSTATLSEIVTESVNETLILVVPELEASNVTMPNVNQTIEVPVEINTNSTSEEHQYVLEVQNVNTTSVENTITDTQTSQTVNETLVNDQPQVEVAFVANSTIEPQNRPQVEVTVNNNSTTESGAQPQVETSSQDQNETPQDIIIEQTHEDVQKQNPSVEESQEEETIEREPRAPAETEDAGNTNENTSSGSNPVSNEETPSNEPIATSDSSSQTTDMTPQDDGEVNGADNNIPSKSAGATPDVQPVVTETANLAPAVTETPVPVTPATEATPLTNESENATSTTTPFVDTPTDTPAVSTETPVVSTETGTSGKNEASTESVATVDVSAEPIKTVAPTSETEEAQNDGKQQSDTTGNESTGNNTAAIVGGSIAAVGGAAAALAFFMKRKPNMPSFETVSEEGNLNNVTGVNPLYQKAASFNNPLYEAPGTESSV